MIEQRKPKIGLLGIMHGLYDEKQPEITENQEKFARDIVAHLKDQGEKILWAPVMAWGEFISLGLASWMVACATPCQKGWLVIVYDKSDRVIDVSEDFLPDEHQLVADCAKSAVRADIGVCQSVRERVRPSLLPNTGVAPDSDRFGEQK